jgi:hypothetical protein
MSLEGCAAGSSGHSDQPSEPSAERDLAARVAQAWRPNEGSPEGKWRGAGAAERSIINTAWSKQLGSRNPIPCFLYRAISKRDLVSGPNVLWSPPPELMTYGRDHVRKLMIEAIAHGNTKETPFLHFAADLHTCYTLMRERGERYTGQVARVDTVLLDLAALVFLNTDSTRRQYLSEEHGPKYPVSYEDLGTARMYAKKDNEILYMAAVPVEAIAIVDHISGQSLGSVFAIFFFRYRMCRIAFVGNM